MSIKKYFIPDKFFWGLLFGRRGTRRFWSLVHNSPLHWWISAFTPSRGTLSVLFGVHQFLWHPYTVARAWRFLYGRWPKWHQWIGIFCHDLGYWGKPSMDGPLGQTHPVTGANLACWLVYYLGLVVYRKESEAMLMSESVRELCLWHSTHYAQLEGAEVSELYLPDKACVLFDPVWFYLLRGWISGETNEYFQRENIKRDGRGEKPFASKREWLRWYRTHIRFKLERFFEDQQGYALNKAQFDNARRLSERRHAIPTA